MQCENKAIAGLEFLPAVRLTMDAVPAVMASTWEWISCLDSSILFLRQAWDALKRAEKNDDDPKFAQR